MTLRSAGGGSRNYQLALLLALHYLIPLSLGIFVAVSGDLTLEGPSGPGFWLPLLATLSLGFLLSLKVTRALRTTSYPFLGKVSILITDLIAGPITFWTSLAVFVAGIFIPFAMGWGSLGLDDLCGQYTLEGCDSADEDLGGAVFSWMAIAAFLSVPLGAVAGALGWVSMLLKPS